MQNNAAKQCDKVDMLIPNFYYWLFFVLTITLCFGYFLTEHTMGVYDPLINFYGNFYSIIAYGRLGDIFQLILGFEYIPFFYEYIGIIIYAASITLTVKCFSKYIKDFSMYHSIIFACITVSFPFAALSFMIMSRVISINLSLFFAIIAVYMFSKNLFENNIHKYYIFSFLSLFLSVSYDGTGIIYFLICNLFIQYKNNLKLKEHIFRIIGLIIKVLITYIFFITIIKFIYDIKFSKLLNSISYDYSSIFSLIKSINNSIAFLLTNFTSTFRYSFASCLLCISIVIFLFLSIYITYKRKSITTFILGLLITIAPLSLFIITGKIESYADFMSFGYVIGFTFLILLDIIDRNKKISYILITIVTLVVLNNAKEINKIYFIENLKYQNDLSIAKFIIHDLYMNNVTNKPILFIGSTKNLTFRNSYNIEDPTINKSIFSYERNKSLTSDIYFMNIPIFIRNHGIDIMDYNKHKVGDKMLNIIRNTVKYMPSYPRIGYIKDMGNYAIVKLGDDIPENN